MTDADHKAPTAEQPLRAKSLVYILAAAFAAIAGFAAVTISAYMARQAEQGLSGAQPTMSEPAASSRDAKGGMTKLVYAAAPKPLPDMTFADGSGQPKTLGDWKGKVVLLNLWATWCAPCKLEMPALNRLQAELGGADFAVVAVSLDRTGIEGPRQFLASNNLDKLGLFIDKTGGMTKKIGALGLPATLIVDREGREIARMLGPAEWDSTAAQDVIRAAVATPVGK